MSSVRNDARQGPPLPSSHAKLLHARPNRPTRARRYRSADAGARHAPRRVTICARRIAQSCFNSNLAIDTPRDDIAVRQGFTGHLGVQAPLGHPPQTYHALMRAQGRSIPKLIANVFERECRSSQPVVLRLPLSVHPHTEARRTDRSNAPCARQKVQYAHASFVCDRKTRHAAACHLRVHVRCLVTMHGYHVRYVALCLEASQGDTWATGEMDV